MSHAHRPLGPGTASSQSACAPGCAFCRAGRAGLARQRPPRRGPGLPLPPGRPREAAGPLLWPFRLSPTSHAEGGAAGAPVGAASPGPLSSLRWERWLPSHTKGFPVSALPLPRVFWTIRRCSAGSFATKSPGCQERLLCAPPHRALGSGRCHSGPRVSCGPGLGSVCIRPGWSLFWAPRPSAAPTAPCLLPEALGARLTALSCGTELPQPGSPAVTSRGSGVAAAGAQQSHTVASKPGCCALGCPRHTPPDPCPPVPRSRKGRGRGVRPAALQVPLAQQTGWVLARP